MIRQSVNELAVDAAGRGLYEITRDVAGLDFEAGLPADTSWAFDMDWTWVSE